MKYMADTGGFIWAGRALSTLVLIGLVLPLSGHSWEYKRGADEGDQLVMWQGEGADSLIVQAGTIATPLGLPVEGTVPHAAVIPGAEGWFVMNDGRLGAPSGSVWSWRFGSAHWQELITTGELPDLAAPHADFIDGAKLKRLTMGAELELHELNLTTGKWLRRMQSQASSWTPTAGPFDLHELVVWSSAGQTLHIFNKRTLQLASFPSDAWAAHLESAEDAAVLRVAEPNVLAFGSSPTSLNRFDFNEKVRYASFSTPFTGASEETASGQRGGVLTSWSFWLLMGTWMALGAWWWKGRRKRVRGVLPLTASIFEGDAFGSQDVVEGIAHWSEPLKAVVLSDQNVFTAAELDALFSIADISSPETLRAKRSRLIQGVNTEFNLLFGYELIRRKRDEHDRRKVLYMRSGLPPQLAKGLHRNRVHELHANNGAYGTDRVSKDSE